MKIEIFLQTTKFNTHKNKWFYGINLGSSYWYDIRDSDAICHLGLMMIKTETYFKAGISIFISKRLF